MLAPKTEGRIKSRIRAQIIDFARKIEKERREKVVVEGINLWAGISNQSSATLNCPVDEQVKYYRSHIQLSHNLLIITRDICTHTFNMLRCLDFLSMYHVSSCEMKNLGFLVIKRMIKERGHSRTFLGEGDT